MTPQTKRDLATIKELDPSIHELLTNRPNASPKQVSGWLFLLQQIDQSGVTEPSKVMRPLTDLELTK